MCRFLLSLALSSPVFSVWPVIPARLISKTPCMPFTLSLPYYNHTVWFSFGLACCKFLFSHLRLRKSPVAPRAHHCIPANLLFAGAVLLSLSTQCCSALHKSFLLLCTSHTCKISFSESPLVSQLSVFYLPAFLLSADSSHCILSPPLCILPLHKHRCTNTGALFKGLFVMSLS